jgi:hypothetical protein
MDKKKIYNNYIYVLYNFSFTLKICGFSYYNSQLFKFTISTKTTKFLRVNKLEKLIFTRSTAYC